MNIFFLHLEQAFESVLEEILSTHFSPINLLFSRFEEYIRLRNTGVAACGLFCFISVKFNEKSVMGESFESRVPYKRQDMFHILYLSLIHI